MALEARKVGRPLIGDAPMTAAQRKARSRSMAKMQTYDVTEWAPAWRGNDFRVAGVCAAVEAAKSCYQAQITSPAWQVGYVTTWVEGGAAAKYFPGADEFGFGGEVPEDAALLVARLGCA